MQAIVQTRYGDIDDLVLAAVERPAPRSDEVLVRVRAASVHADVWHVVTGRPYVMRLMGSGLRRPKQRVPGTDVAGIVEAVGEEVTDVSVGDEVFGETVRSHQWKNGGAFAEYATLRADRLARKPPNVTFAQAAAVPTSGMIAMDVLFQQGAFVDGESVLVNGAGGALGVFIVQLAARHASTVTAVDSAGKLETLRTLGADRVMDYALEDPTRGSDRYDVIVDIPGNHPWSAWRQVLTPTGRYVMVGHDHYGVDIGPWFGAFGKMMPLIARSPFSKQLPGFTKGIPQRDRMAQLAAMLEDGTLVSVVDREFPLAEATDAMHYLASGAAVGKVVLVI